MSLTDIAKLRVLLPHWSEYDLSHANDRDLFLCLTEVIMSMTDIAAEHLAAAVEKLAGVNCDLETLLAQLGGPLAAGAHSHHHDAHDHHPHDG
jgi:hypothetical protein